MAARAEEEEREREREARLRGVVWLKRGLAPTYPAWLMARPDFGPLLELRADSARVAALEVLQTAADAAIDAGAQRAGAGGAARPGEVGGAGTGAAELELAVRSARSLAALASACSVPPSERRPVHTLTVAKHLARLPVCVGMTAEEVRSVSGEVYVAGAAAGAQIFTQGDDANSFYVLLAGRVDVAVDPIGRTHSLGPGEWFGERALVQAETRACSAVAAAPCTLLVMAREDFSRALKRSETQRLIRHTDFLQGLPFFAGWSRPRLSRLLALFTETRFPAGHVLAEQGDDCGRVVVVLDGTVGLWHTAVVTGTNRVRTVVQRSTDHVGVARPGAIYGLHLAARGARHPLRVATITPVRALVAPSGIFRAAQGGGSRADVFAGMGATSAAAAAAVSRSGPASGATRRGLEATAAHGIDLVPGASTILLRQGREAPTGADEQPGAERRASAALRASRRRGSVAGLEYQRQRSEGVAALRSMTVEEAAFALRRALFVVEEAQTRRRDAMRAQNERDDAEAEAAGPAPAPDGGRMTFRSRRGSIGVRSRPVGVSGAAAAMRAASRFRRRARNPRDG